MHAHDQSKEVTADFFLSAVNRGQRLEESLEYQQFVANVEEEEAWINEKMTLVASEDYGDTLAAIQVREPGDAPASFLSPCLWSPGSCWFAERLFLTGGLQSQRPRSHWLALALKSLHWRCHLSPKLA